MRTVFLFVRLIWHFLCVRHYRKLANRISRSLQKNIKGKPEAFYHDAVLELDRATKLADIHYARYHQLLAKMKERANG